MGVESKERVESVPGVVIVGKVFEGLPVRKTREKNPKR